MFCEAIVTSCVQSTSSKSTKKYLILIKFGGITLLHLLYCCLFILRCPLLLIIYFNSIHLDCYCVDPAFNLDVYRGNW